MSDLFCFLPLSLSEEQRLCPKAALTFYSFLSENIEKLDRSLAEGPVISLRWSVEAMDLLKKLQIELLQLIKKWKLPVAHGAEEDWHGQYMEETLSLLDFCNSLKSAISGMDRYRMVVDLTLQKLIIKGSPSFRISVEEIELGRLATGCTTVNLGGSREIGFLNKNTKKTDKTMASVMLAAKCTMAVVSMLLVSVIVSPVPIDIRCEKLTSEFPQLKPFMLVLTALVTRFQGRVLKPKNDSCSLVLAEHEMVDSIVEDLKALIAQGVKGEDDRERFLESAKLLRTSSDELREGIERFDAVVDEVFDLVLKGRHEMLDAFKAGTLSWN